MKRSILRAFALCLTTALVAGTACAQDTPDKPDSSKSRTDSTTPTPQGGPGATAGAYGSTTSMRAGQPARMSKLINTSLRGQTGESLGQVQDILIDPTSGQVQFVVLSLDGTATGAPGTSTTTTTTTDSSVSSPRTSPSGIGSYGTPSGGRLVAIPWRLISSTGSDQYTATVDRMKLQSAPTFSSAAWPTMDSAWSQRVYSHFGVDATGRGAPGTDTSTGTGTSTAPGTSPGIGNPSTPGVPSTPGTPDITPPAGGTTPVQPTPGTVPGASGTRPSSGTGK